MILVFDNVLNADELAEVTGSMSYGRHVDDPFMVGKQPIRTDLGFDPISGRARHL